MPERVFSDKFLLIENKRDMDSRNHFSLSVPNDVVSLPAPPSSSPARPFVPIAAFAAGKSSPYFLTLFRGFAAFEINVGDLLNYELRKDQWKVTRQIYRPDSHGCDTQLFVEKTIDGELWVGRSRAVQDGDRLFRVDAVTKATSARDEMDKLSVPIQTFSLLSPEKLITSQPCHRQMATKDKPYEFQYPASWEIHESERLAKGYRLLHRRNSRLLGTITIEAFQGNAKDTPHALFKQFAIRLENEGMHFSGSPIWPMTPPKGFVSCHLYTPITTHESSNLAVFGHLVQQPPLSILVGVISPKKELIPLLFLTNKRALEIIIASLKLQSSVLF